MAFLNRTLIVLSILFFYTRNNIAHAQLWRYLNDSPEKQKAADNELKKEAFSVITKKTVAYGGTFTYDVMAYAIKTFDGFTAKVNLWEKPFSGHVFHIELTGNSLAIGDFYSLERVHHLSDNLLEIVYSPRGGSDDGYNNVLVLGVNKGKFCIMAEIQSIHEFDDGYYNLNLKLQGTGIDNYQIAIKARDLLKSKDNKCMKNHDKRAHFLLKFDKDQHIFYTDSQKLDAYIYQEDIKKKKYHVIGFYPMINLSRYRYCFFNKTWYSVWKNQYTGEVTMFSYCHRPNLP
ncbi:hypothetical protein [Mucilaginibacter sp. SP1R1]|uniref:hypothetical protein n=1 Tax=Mucilaginibacter sp. SP1R1 TaxID=2723091 RepID=UPI00160A4537|nr:hypothetical protein [Mucilaginibacter sp. SP1R1]MBB6151779.1 hypothetical protein [Mucilaginibacter sp. SP1R1]